MIYAVRERGGHQTLVEFRRASRFNDYNEAYRDAYLVSEEQAHQWVRDGKEHETGLYVEGGIVRYAFPETREA